MSKSRVQINVREGEILQISPSTVLVKYAERDGGSYVINVPRNMAPSDAEVGDSVRITMRQRAIHVEML